MYQGLQPALREAGVRAFLESDAPPVWVCGDYDYLKEAILRVFQNAIRYTPAGGAITVRVAQIDNRAVIEISDTGRGIGDKDLPHIFERFYRSDDVASIQGFGLGLPIAQAVVELHGGRIEVESRAGQGSTFRLLLPVTPAGG